MKATEIKFSSLEAGMKVEAGRHGLGHLDSSNSNCSRKEEGRRSGAGKTTRMKRTARERTRELLRKTARRRKRELLKETAREGPKHLFSMGSVQMNGGMKKGWQVTRRMTTSRKEGKR